MENSVCVFASTFQNYFFLQQFNSTKIGRKSINLGVRLLHKLFGGARGLCPANLNIEERTKLLDGCSRRSWGSGGLPPEKFFKNTPSRTSPDDLLKSGTNTMFIIDLLSEKE